MSVARAFSAQSSAPALDELLLQICEELQLTPARYDLAVDRYNTLNRVLESKDSPFRHFHPEIYPQGSMALGTTVKPTEGPHDLDFVLQLSRDHSGIDPMALIRTLFGFLREHGTYRPMTKLKNRCVRIEYADDFYMDVLPACRNGAAGGTCIKVPDRLVRGWCDSNPLGYVDWFKERSRLLLVEELLERAAPVPAQQAVAAKKTLELVVQLIKRWRDLYYADSEPDLAPISIVLTTLAGHVYRGERSVSRALTTVANGVVALIDGANARGTRLRILNPSNPLENLSERWDANPAAYTAFEEGMRDFLAAWVRLVGKAGNVDPDLQQLFGEPVTNVLRKRAQKLQESRRAGGLGVTRTGLIVSSSEAAVRVRPNTFHGQQ